MRGPLFSVPGLLLALCCLALSAPSALGAVSPYQVDPVLSLTGACGGVGPSDPVEDPGCPGGVHPPSGRFDLPRSVAVDDYGNQYVASYGPDGTKGRIDVFDDEGYFLTELLDPHGPKSVAVDSKGNLYVYEQAPNQYSEIALYEPSVYKPEEGEISYAKPRVVIATAEDFPATGGLAINRDNDHLIASLGQYINEYGSAAEGNALLDTITHEKLFSTTWVAVDAQRDRLFASSCPNRKNNECVVLVFEDASPYKLVEEIDGSSVPVGEFKSGKGWTSIAVDEETGYFFIEDLELTDNVYEFNEDYEYVSTITNSAFQGGDSLQIAVSNAPGAFNEHYLFVPVASPGGTGRVLAYKPGSECIPKVQDLEAKNIAEREAELLAVVDPCGGETHYVFEYVTQAEFEEQGFAAARVGGEGTVPPAAFKTQVIALLQDLAPGTPYRFRLVAENKMGSKAMEGAFATYSDASFASSCPNGALRKGLSALLPDCRAYELVTPPDTNGRPPIGGGFSGDLFSTLHASPLGNAVTFNVEGGTLPGMGGSGGWHGEPYRSIRGPSGWTTVGVGPSGAESTIPLPGSASPDQGHSFWLAGGEGSAVVNGQEGRYVRYPDGRSELIGRGSLGSDPTARGKIITENGSHIIFQTVNMGLTVAQQLEPDAPPSGTAAVYDRTADEVTHVVSLLPGDVTPAQGEHAFYLGASPDGAGVAFEIGNTLYLRVGNSVTYEIGENVAFAGVSESGKRIFYMEGGDLYAFDAGSQEAIAFSDTNDVTPVNVASGGLRAYFVSPSVLGGENSNGATAKAGEQNLYLSEEGAISFVATVTDRDVEGETSASLGQFDGLGLWVDSVAVQQPAKDPSRLTPDGQVLLFQSRANLDDYDSGGAPEIYRYDSTADRLHCISCIPTGIPSGGGSSLQSFFGKANPASPFVTAFDFVSNLSPDGQRAVFESDEALVSTDGDGVKDVYEWEEEGTGSCSRPGGCLYLLSSGQSNRADYLFAVSQSGDDVFFITTDVLNGFDAGNTASIYDARVEGGFPELVSTPCQGEGCRPNTVPPPPLPVSESGARSKSGNVPPRKGCPKGKRKVKRHGKVRCVKKRGKQHGKKGRGR